MIINGQRGDGHGVPADCLRLSVAFRAFVLALYPESGGIAGMDAAKDWREFTAVIGNAEIEFRNRLASDDGPQAYARDPKNGERLQLAKEDWIFPAGSLRLGLGFPDDFISHDDSIGAYGPAGAFMYGNFLPVFFVRADFEKFMAKISAASKLATHAKAGRPTIIPDVIAPELDRWIESKHAGLVAKLKEHGQSGQKSGLAVARALKAWAESLDHSDVPDARSIQNALRAKIIEADRLL
jgi:hypothetical protein